MPLQCRHTSYNAVTPAISFDIYLWLHKALLLKSEGLPSYGALKSPISRDKSMLLFGKCL